MRNSRTSINTELKTTKRIPEETTLLGRFESIIAKQQEIIYSLHSEVMLLKSYISLERTSSPFEVNCSDISLNTTISNESQLRPDIEETNAQLQKQGILNRIGQVLEIKSNNETPTESAILSAIEEIKEKLKKSQEPVFVQRVKEIKVPIIVEKPIQKIIYIEKGAKLPDKNLQKPLFKEKYEDRFNQRTEDDDHSHSALNKTCSERYLKPRKEDAYEPRYQQRQKYDSYRRGDSGQNLIKKRAEYPKQYYKRY